MSQNDYTLIEHLKKQLEEKKDLIGKLTNDLTTLEYQVKDSENNEKKLNKRIKDLTDKINHYGVH